MALLHCKKHQSVVSLHIVCNLVWGVDLQRVDSLWLTPGHDLCCLSSAETLPHEENGLMKEQRYMDSASNSMTPRPQTVRSSSEYHSQTSSLYHRSSSFSSSSAELSSPQPLRRVEGEKIGRFCSISWHIYLHQCFILSSKLHHRPRVSVGARPSASAQ